MRPLEAGAGITCHICVDERQRPPTKWRKTLFNSKESRIEWEPSALVGVGGFDSRLGQRPHLACTALVVSWHCKNPTAQITSSLYWRGRKTVSTRSWTAPVAALQLRQLNSLGLLDSITLRTQGSDFHDFMIQIEKWKNKPLKLPIHFRWGFMVTVTTALEWRCGSVMSPSKRTTLGNLCFRSTRGPSLFLRL